MDTEIRKGKEEALEQLLKFSMLISYESKEKILATILKFSDEELDALGKVLAVEHRNRGMLDDEMLKDLQAKLSQIAK